MHVSGANTSMCDKSILYAKQVIYGLRKTWCTCPRNVSIANRLRNIIIVILQLNSTVEMTAHIITSDRCNNWLHICCIFDYIQRNRLCLYCRPNWNDRQRSLRLSAMSSFVRLPGLNQKPENSSNFLFSHTKTAKMTLKVDRGHYRRHNSI